MKNILLFTLLFPIFASAQTVSYHVQGQIKNVGESKYAYLVSYTKPDFFLVSPINNNSFEFRSVTPLGDYLVKSGILFFDRSPDITAEEFKAKTENRVWNPGLDEKFFSFVLEDVVLEIDSPAIAKAAKITNGGIYNLQREQFSTALKEKSLPACVKKYNDSNFTLNYLQGLVRFYELPGGKSTDTFGDIKLMFESLSDRLKNTPQGLKLKRQIDLL